MTSCGNPIVGVLAWPANKVNPLCIKGFPPFVVDIAFIDDNDATGLELQGSGHGEVAALARGDGREARDVAIMIQTKVELQSRLFTIVIGPGKDRQ